MKNFFISLFIAFNFKLLATLACYLSHSPILTPLFISIGVVITHFIKLNIKGGKFSIFSCMWFFSLTFGITTLVILIKDVIVMFYALPFDITDAFYMLISLILGQHTILMANESSGYLFSSSVTESGSESVSQSGQPITQSGNQSTANSGGQSTTESADRFQAESETPLNRNEGSQENDPDHNMESDNDSTTSSDSWQSVSSGGTMHPIQPNAGGYLDRTRMILDTVGNDPEATEKYFAAKKQAIITNYRESSNAGAIEGAPISELQEWLDDKNSMLEDLKSQEIVIKRRYNNK